MTLVKHHIMAFHLGCCMIKFSGSFSLKEAPFILKCKKESSAFLKPYLSALTSCYATLRINTSQWSVFEAQIAYLVVSLIGEPCSTFQAIKVKFLLPSSKLSTLCYNNAI